MPVAGEGEQGKQCCKLSSALAHEANHMGSFSSGNSDDEASGALEEACFGCKSWTNLKNEIFRN